MCGLLQALDEMEGCALVLEGAWLTENLTPPLGTSLARLRTAPTTTSPDYFELDIENTEEARRVWLEAHTPAPLAPTTNGTTPAVD